MSEKEIIICSAVKAKSGYIARCHRHHHGLRVIHDMLHEEVDRHPRAQGFLTSLNRFVSREEGLKLQIEAGIQSVAPGGYRAEDLFSEDLY